MKLFFIYTNACKTPKIQIQIMCHPENNVVLLADGFEVEFPPVPKSCRQNVCKTVVWLQSGGIRREP